MFVGINNGDLKMEIAIRHKSSGRIHRRVNELQILHSDLLATATGGFPGSDPHYSRWECGWLDAQGNFITRSEYKQMHIIEQEVRPATAQDWPAILKMSDALWRLDPEQHCNVIPDNASVFVATTSDGLIVGMVCCHQATDGVMPLSHLFVTPLHRSQGIATALIKCALFYAGDATDVVLSMQSSNRTLRRFYKKFGFKPDPLINLRRAAA